MSQRRLPDIRDLTDDPRPDRGAQLHRALHVLALVGASIAIGLAALVVWLERHTSSHPASAYAWAAALLAVVPAVIGFRAVRSEGLDIAIYVGVILTVVAWMCAMIFIAVMSATTGWDFF